MRKNRALINTLSSILLQITIIICGLIIPKRIIMVFGSDVNGIITSITKFLSLIILMESGFGVVIKSLLFKPIANKDTKQVEKILKASEKMMKLLEENGGGYSVKVLEIEPVPLKAETKKCGKWKLSDEVKDAVLSMFV